MKASDRLNEIEHKLKMMKLKMKIIKEKTQLLINNKSKRNVN